MEHAHDFGVIYGIARDVTERAALAEEQVALRRVATLVARESSPEEVFAAVAEEMGRLLGAARTALWRFEDDGTGTLAAAWPCRRRDAGRGVDPRRRKRCRAVAPRSEERKGPLARAAACARVAPVHALARRPVGERC